MEDKNWRSTFNKQPSHLIILDASPPMTSKIIADICESLFRVLAVSCNMKGPIRLPELGITLFGKGNVFPVVPLLSVKTNYIQFKNGLTNILDIYKTVFTCENKNSDDLIQVFQDAISQYMTRCKKAYPADQPPLQMEIAFITSQCGRDVSRKIENSMRSIDLSCIKKIQVVSITDICVPANEALFCEDKSPDLWSPSSHSSSGTDQVIGVNIEVIPGQYGVFQPECFFKHWLQDCNTDVEHVQISMPSNNASITVKCDLQEIILNPHLLSSSDKFFLSTDGMTFQVAPTGNQSKSGHKQQVPVYHLNIVKVLKLSGVCESVLFGNPLLLYPTQCWKMDWEELEVNQEMFVALCQELSKRNCGLLLKREDVQAGVKGHSGSLSFLQGYFLAIPAQKNNTMLIKPLVTRELLMPISPTVEAISTSKPSQDAINAIQDVLKGFPVDDSNYDPVDVSCGLSDHLTSAVSKARPQKRRHNLITSQIPNTQDTFYLK